MKVVNVIYIKIEQRNQVPADRKSVDYMTYIYI